MKIRSYKLIGNDGRRVPFEATPNKNPGEVRPEFLVMHYTAGATRQGTVSWFQNKSARASAHLVLGRDGSVVEMGEFNESLWHAGSSQYAGRKGFNRFSIGIEIVNWGKLAGGPGNWRSWAGTKVDDNCVAVATHTLDTKPTGWELYEDKKLPALSTRTFFGTKTAACVFANRPKRRVCTDA